MKKIALLLCLLLFSHSFADDKLDKIIQEFDTYAETQRDLWQVPGMAISIVKGDEVLLSKGYGKRGLKDTRPVNEKTLFQIGSLTKAFTATLVTKGIELNWFKWDDKVVNHMPTFRLHDPFASTEFEMIDLLAQRSGLPSYAGDTQAFLGYSQKEMFQHMHFLQPVSSFRSKFGYQNIFFLVAAHILEKKAGMTFAALLEEEIFTPLKMTNSNASLREFLAADNRAEWLMRLDDGSTITLEEDFPYRNWNYVLGPAGGINSTAADMANWMILQANSGKFNGKQLFSSTNMQLLTKPMIYVGEMRGLSLYYALGWVHMENSPYAIIWHDGSTLGVYNVAAFIPEEKLGIVILSNVRNTQLAYALALQFFDMYFGKQNQNWGKKLLPTYTKETKEETGTKTAARPLSIYAGTYSNPIYGNVVVREEEGHLVMVIGKTSQRLSLNPWGGDVFTMLWPYVDDKGSKVVFSSNDENKIAKMNITLFDKDGTGDFIRISE